MHISILLATAKTRAINPKEPAKIQKAEHEDAPCDERASRHIGNQFSANYFVV